MPRSARRWGSSNSERGAEVSGSRFAYVMREAVLVELALLAVGHGHPRPRGVRRRSRRRCSCASRRWRRPASSPPTGRRSTRSTAVSCSSSAPARCRSRRCTAARSSPPTRCRCATRACRRTSGARRARTARTRAASSACTSSTRSRCSATRIPTTSWEEHDRILAIEEEIYGGLGLPYRVVNIAAGDLGAAAAKKYDIEAWLPSEGRYRELTSCSNYLDYSARRLGTRFRDVDGTRSCTRSTAPRARSRAR